MKWIRGAAIWATNSDSIRAFCDNEERMEGYEKQTECSPQRRNRIARSSMTQPCIQRP